MDSQILLLEAAGPDRGIRIGRLEWWNQLQQWLSDMTASAEQIFLLARDLKGDARSDLLDQNCGADAALRAEVESLLTAHAAAGDFLGGEDVTTEHATDPKRLDAHGESRDGFSPSSGEGPGTIIGRYKLLDQIGEGGMGMVYLAEQTEPVTRRVALKLIKLGMDTRAVVARFEAERQALALMSHPAVAKVFDAGATETGRPYFVMEFVPGVAITRFCDLHCLTVQERLQLLAHVCDAVQHAHQKGIIHRDLKPTNVLVARENGAPAVKVIDFGVAKAVEQRLTEETMFTALGQMIGTPSYMSPEQAEASQLGVDARTDVYSLGVLAYELLVGVLPFEPRSLRSAGYREMQRIIREVDPPRPSTRFSSLGSDSSAISESRRLDVRKMRRMLVGDLDWIVMKAMDKDPGRRYASVSELAADIKRYLGDEIVVARPPSSSYKLRKFVRRNRLIVSAAMAIALSLVLGIVATSIATVRAFRAERRAADEAVKATQQAEIAEAVNEFLNDDLLAAVAPSHEAGRGKDVSMREVLDVAAARIDAASQPGGRFADKPLVEAAIRATLGDTYRELGVHADARPHLERALRLQEQLLPRGHVDTLRTMRSLALNDRDTGALEEAERLFRRALALCEEMRGPEEDETLRAINNMATFYQLQDRFEEAIPLHERLLEIHSRTLGPDHPDTIASRVNLANGHLRMQRLDHAEELLDAALSSGRRRLDPGGPMMAMIYKNYGELKSFRGHLEEAGEYFGDALRIRREIYGPDHPTTLTSTNDLAVVAFQQGKLDEAQELFREIADSRERVLGPTAPMTISARVNHAIVYLNTERLDEGEKAFREILRVAEPALGPDHAMVLRSRSQLAWVLGQTGRLADSAAIHEQILERRRQTLGDDHPETMDSYDRLTWTYDKLERYTEAARMCAELLRLRRQKLGHESMPAQTARHELVRLYLAAGDPDAARPLAQERIAFEHGLANADGATASRKEKFARLLLTVMPEDLRDPSLALEFARDAVTLAEDAGAHDLHEYLTTLAKCLYETGSSQDAITTQARAIALLPENTSAELRNTYEKRLAAFERVTPSGN